MDWLYTALAAAGIWIAAHFNFDHVVAGFLGSITRATLTKTGSFLERLFGGFIGATFAAYFTPLLTSLFGIDDPTMMSAFAFSVGMFGIYVFDSALKSVRSWANDPASIKEFLRELILRFLNKPNGKE